MKRNIQILQIIIIVLLVLWIPAALDKMINFNTFQQSMYRQSLSKSVATLVIYSLPILKFMTILLLLFPKYQLWGSVLSNILIDTFKIYIAFLLIKVLDKTPCGFGLIIPQMHWIEHYWFNQLLTTKVL